MVIWLIGMSGAGKTSIGTALHQELKQRRPNTVMLDGDVIRDVIGDNLGHHVEARRTNGWRMARLGRWLDNQGIDVVCAILSIFPEQQAWNRQHVDRYFEVYVKVPMPVLMERDYKGLYAGAKAGTIPNVVGVDIDFPEPQNADLVIENDRIRTGFAEPAMDILNALPEGWC